MHETSRARAAFSDYCAMGIGRSLAKLAAYDKPPSNLRQLQEWSRMHRWQIRVAEYDAEQLAERERRRAADIEQMNERHASIGMEQQLRAVAQIEQLIASRKFGSQAAVQLLKLATDLERLARGTATERAELTGKNGAPLVPAPQEDAVLGAFTDEEFSQLKALRAAAQQRLEQVQQYEHRTVGDY